MPDYRLYHMPGSCSRVAINALEEIGVSYVDQGVALMRGAHHEPWFRAINPKSKVPVLVADDATITELPAILYYLACAHPGAALLSADVDGQPTLESLSDMIWMSGALHPIVNRIFRPAAISATDPEGVKATAIAQLEDYAIVIAARLDRGGYWYGAHWSIADTFLAWLFNIAGDCGFPLEKHTTLADLNRRMMVRAAFVRAVERERAAVVRDELPLPPGITL